MLLLQRDAPSIIQGALASSITHPTSRDCCLVAYHYGLGLSMTMISDTLIPKGFQLGLVEEKVLSPETA